LPVIARTAARLTVDTFPTIAVLWGPWSVLEDVGLERGQFEKKRVFDARNTSEKAIALVEA
jgi:hypothetical protein